jgi:hypothetical protein
MTRRSAGTRRWLSLALASIAALAFWVSAGAQEQALRIAGFSVDEQMLRVTVEGPSGLDAFAASIDGVEAPASIADRTGTASTVVFVVETSSSMGGGRDARALEAVQTVLDGLAPGDSAALVTFGTTVEVLVAPTVEHASIVEALAAHQPSRAASLYTGVHTGFTLTSFSEAPSSVVLITMGWNFSGSGSKTSIEALTLAQASGAAGYVVALQSDVNTNFLGAVAALGGLPLVSDNATDLASVSAAIEARRGTSYELSVPLAGLEGGAHELVVGSAGLSAATSFDVPVVTAPPVVPTEAPAPPVEASPAPVEASPAVVAPTVAATAAPTVAATLTPSVVADVPVGDGSSDRLIEQIAAGVVALLLIVLIVLSLLVWRFVRRRTRRQSVTDRLGVATYDDTRAARGRLDIADGEAPERDAAAASDEPPATPLPIGPTGAVPVTLSYGHERHEFAVSASATTVGSAPEATVQLGTPGAPFIHSVFALDTGGRPVAILLATDGAVPRRIELSHQVPTEVGGARIEVPEGATAAA